MKIRRAVAADLAEITDVYATAFQEEKLTTWLFLRRNEYPDHYRRELSREIRSKFYTPGHVVSVVEAGGGEEPEENKSPDSPHQILGFAIWERHGTSEDARVWQKDSFIKKLERLLQSITTGYQDLILPDQSADPTRLAILSESDVFQGITERWHLCNIATLPSFQGRGIASLLTEWGIKIAEQEKVPITLEATINAESLYRRLGFRDYSYMVLADGIDGPALIWEPNALKGVYGTRFPPKGALVGKGEGRKWKPVDAWKEDSQSVA